MTPNENAKDGKYIRYFFSDFFMLQMKNEKKA